MPIAGSPWGTGFRRLLSGRLWWAPRLAANLRPSPSSFRTAAPGRRRCSRLPKSRKLNMADSAGDEHSPARHDTGRPSEHSYGLMNLGP